MSQDRKTLIRLASTLPKGSDARRVLLAELQKTAKFSQGLLEGSLEIAADHRMKLSPSQKAVWERSGSIDTCPVCGSRNTELPHTTYDEDYGYGECKNCGSEWQWAADVEIKPEEVMEVDYWVGNTPLNQYPTKWSWLGMEAAISSQGKMSKREMDSTLSMCASNGKTNLTSYSTDNSGTDKGTERAWVANGNVYTCPVCGSNKTEVTNSARTEKAKSLCKNCGSEYWWAGEIVRKPNNVDEVSFGGRFGNGNKAPLREQPKKGTFLYDEAKAAGG
jgi:transcription elongation factor Elf1